MSLDNTLWLSGILAEIAVFVLLLYRQVWRTLPVFCLFCLWALLSDASGYIVLRFFPSAHFAFYLLQTMADSCLQLGILIELIWSVLRPLQANLRRSTPILIGVLIVAIGAVIWPFVSIHGIFGLPPQWRFLVRVQQTASILRVLIFMLLAGGGQLLSINWRDRELQVATALGFFSMVSLFVEMMHSHQTMGPQYLQLNQIVVASYLCCFLYWIFCFAQKEVERRAFTPQMESFLLTVAGSARATRVALTEASLAKTPSTK